MSVEFSFLYTTRSPDLHSNIPSIVSMVLNRGKRENVIADKTALNDVEDLDKTLARIKNDGEYLGEFSFTAVIYT
ncbi:MAG: hypothetical protein JO138_06130 [Acidobacteriaceae bacterium]|nr:hypothetical protein [Acidobacteriaceae bacterium]